MDSILGACVLNVLQRAARNSVDLLSYNEVIYSFESYNEILITFEIVM